MPEYGVEVLLPVERLRCSRRFGASLTNWRRLFRLFFGLFVIHLVDPNAYLIGRTGRFFDFLLMERSFSRP